MRKLTIVLTFLAALALSVSAQAAYQSIGAGPGVLWGSERVKINENFVELYAWHWSAETAYVTGDFVFYGQKVWKALQNSTGTTPTEGATWTSQLGTGGGTGNVTVSGAPTVGQVATWVSGTAIQGVALPTFVTSLAGQSWNFTAGFDVRNTTSANFGPLVLAAGDTSPATSGELRYDTAVTGMSAGALAYMNSGSEVRYIVDIPTLPTIDSILRYNPDTDEYEFVANTSAAANISVADSGAHFAGETVEAVLQEVAVNINEIEEDIAEITVGAPVTTAPTYSNEECTTGQYAFDETYVYYCIDTDTWDRIALAGWDSPEPGGITLTSTTIPSTGDSATLLFSEEASVGSGGNAGWAMECSTAGAVTMTYSSGDGNTSLVYTLGETIDYDETCTVDYTQPGDGIENSIGSDLSTFTEAVVTNNSEVNMPLTGALIDDDFSSDTSADYITISRGITVTGGHAEGGGNGYQPAAVLHETAIPSFDHYVQARLIYSGTNPRFTTALLGRSVAGDDPTANAGGYFIWMESNSGCNLYRFANSNLGAPTWVNAWNYGQTWADNEDYVVRVEFQGSDIKLYIDWNDDGDFEDTNESVGTIVDETYTGPMVGLRWNNLDGTEGWIDDLEAGPLATSELLAPDGDNAAAWVQSDTDNVGTNHYARMDEAPGSEDIASTSALYANGGNRDEYTLANPTSMDSGDTATQLTVAVYGRGQGGTCEVQVQYSLNGSTWTTIDTIDLQATYSYVAATVGGLSLSLADVQNMHVSIQRTDGQICDVANLAVEVTY